LNKVDVVPKPNLLPLIDRFRKEFDFAAIFPVSALKGTGCRDLLHEIFRLLPEGQPYFPEDQVTDQPERFLAAEIIREKAIRALHHELPYALAVLVDKYEETQRLVRIEATLNVERDTQKKILIGHKGVMLKKIGTEARKELESILSAKVFLGLFVKVAQDWRDNPQRVRELDWHFQLEGLSAVQAHDPEDEEEGPEG
jgi:GTPase